MSNIQTQPRYAMPGAPGNEDSDEFKVPSNAEIIKDFRLAGGFLTQLLETHVADSDSRQAIGLAIYSQLNDDPQAMTEFNQIAQAAMVASGHEAKDRLIELASNAEKGANQFKAIKAVTALSDDCEESKEDA